MLLKAGADPNAALTKDGRTVLMQAVDTPKLDASVINALLKAGADPHWFRFERFDDGESFGIQVVRDAVC